jgi:hypothetical protein
MSHSGAGRRQFIDEDLGFVLLRMASQKQVQPLTYNGKAHIMNDRLRRIEFFSLYELYLQKNEEFRQAVNARCAPDQINVLRENISHIFNRLAEKRGHLRPSMRDGRSAP